MKRLFSSILLLVLLVCGCEKRSGEIGGAMAFRQKLLTGDGCSFSAVVTADYGDKLYGFKLQCAVNKSGDLTFSVTEPEVICGINGKVTDSGGRVTFDGNALAFETIADGYITPVSAPWVFIKALRSGYIVSCAPADTLTYLQINDSYKDDALHLDVWLNDNSYPVRAEILYRGKRILSIAVEDFQLL